MTRNLYVTLAAMVGAMAVWSAAAQAGGARGYLPDEATVREAIAGSPDVMAAEAKRDATLARASGSARARLKQWCGPLARGAVSVSHPSVSRKGR